MRWNARICAVFGLVLAPSFSMGAEPIRVLLQANALQVTVFGQEKLVARLPGGETRPLDSTVIVRPMSGAIQISGEQLPIDRVTVTGGQGDLRVVIKKPPPSEELKTLKPLPPAVFIGSAPKPKTSVRRTPKVSRSGSQEGLVVGGALRFVSKGNGLAVINVVDLEEYVRGVVPAEMSAWWHPEVLKVQAVASRTYALYQRMLRVDQEYDVVATVLDQVYRGRAVVDRRVRLAVESTKGLAVTYEGRPVLAAFSSTAAGPTEDAMNVWVQSQDVPYLKGVECPFDRNSPYYQWRAAFELDGLEHRLRQAGYGVGTIATITPYLYSEGGRISKLRILHSEGELVLRGQDLRRIAGYRVIPSTRFSIESLGSEIRLLGYGNGHAVGLCQWGAKELAQLGYPFAAILQYYYPGTTLKRDWRLDATPSSGQ